jgi:hypothetical protein
MSPHSGAEPAMTGSDLPDALAALRGRDLMIRCDQGACTVTIPRGLLQEADPPLVRLTCPRT